MTPKSIVQTFSSQQREILTNLKAVKGERHAEAVAAFVSISAKLITLAVATEDHCPGAKMVCELICGELSPFLRLAGVDQAAILADSDTLLTLRMKAQEEVGVELRKHLGE